MTTVPPFWGELRLWGKDDHLNPTGPAPLSFSASSRLSLPHLAILTNSHLSFLPHLNPWYLSIARPPRLCFSNELRFRRETTAETDHPSPPWMNTTTSIASPGGMTQKVTLLDRPPRAQMLRRPIIMITTPMASGG